MGRNRKNGSAVRFVPAVQAALVCALLGGSAIGYVYQKNQIIELGKRIQEREKRLAGLRIITPSCNSCCSRFSPHTT